MVTMKSLFSALEPYGFSSLGANCFGVWSGYAVDLRYLNNSFQICFAIRADKKDKTLAKNLLTNLRQQLGKRVTSVLNNGDHVAVIPRFDGKSPLDQQFGQLADAVAGNLRGMGLYPANTCAVCGGGTPESLCLVSTYQPVHASCIHQAAQSVRDAAEENKENGSYATGALGAVLGAVVGAIPSIILLLATNYISGILFALVPLAAMFGYRKFKGKNDKVGIGIVIVVSLLAVILMAYVLLVFLFMKGYGVSFSTAVTYAKDTLTYDFGEVVGNFWQGFLFMVLGIFISWNYLTKTGAAQVNDVELQLQTLRPNPLCQQPQAQAQAEIQPQQPLWQ